MGYWEIELSRQSQVLAVDAATMFRTSLPNKRCGRLFIFDVQCVARVAMNPFLCQSVFRAAMRIEDNEAWFQTLQFRALAETGRPERLTARFSRSGFAKC